MSVSLLNPTNNDSVNRLLSIRGEGLITFNNEGLVNYTSPLFLTLTGAGAGELIGMTEPVFSNWLAQRSQLAAPFSGVDLLRQRALQDKNRHKEQIQISAENASGTRLELTWCCVQSADVSGALFVRHIHPASNLAPSKQKFLATAAHDLRTPLAGITGFADVLQTQALDAQTQQAFLKIIADQAALLTQMLGEVFDLARMDALQGTDYGFVCCSLQSLLTDIVAQFVPPAGRSPPVVRMPTQSLWVMADAPKLALAINHVLANAYQYSPDGGAVNLEISSPKNTGQVDRVCLQVSDRGIGMTPEQALQIFDRFFRVSTPSTTAGSGLGMSAAQHIIERHHGDIQVLSTLGQGTQVALYLPLAAPIA